MILVVTLDMASTTPSEKPHDSFVSNCYCPVPMTVTAVHQTPQLFFSRSFLR